MPIYFSWSITALLSVSVVRTITTYRKVGAFLYCVKSGFFANNRMVVRSTSYQRALDARVRDASSDPSQRRRISLSSSERAVPRGWSVNPTRLTCRNEPDSDDLCRDGALVSDNVHVGATFVNKRHPRCVHVRRAGGIVSLILCHCSCGDKDQGMARMRVPAGAPSRLPDIDQDRPV